MDLSVIIVNWHSADYLKGCLTALYRNTEGIRFEAIVIDNASYDGSEQMVRECFPQTLFLQSKQNLGFARANNLGYRRSSGEILVFLNPDTEVLGDALRHMADYLRTTPLAGAVGARLLNTDGSLQKSCISAFPTLWNQILDFDLLRRLTPRWHLWGTEALYGRSSAPAPVDAISGACFMVKRGVFESVGLFSEDYFMYSDDLDLSYRIHQSGYRIYYISDCHVIHHGAKSSVKQRQQFSDVQQRQSLADFFRKTRGRRHARVYRTAMACMSIVRLVILACLFPVGGLGVKERGVSAAMRKWATILRWAIGSSPSPILDKRA